jgi:hypothetical protein
LPRLGSQAAPQPPSTTGASSSRPSTLPRALMTLPRSGMAAVANVLPLSAILFCLPVGVQLA